MAVHRFSTPAASLGCLTDLYQLTMAQGYWKAGRSRWQAVYHLTFRSCPFGGGFAIASGLETAAEWLADLHFSADEIDYLAGLNSPGGAPMFDPDFLRVLAALRLSLDVDAVREGALVFPHEPLIRVTGPLLQAQLVETGLLCLVNFETLIASKAARVRLAAGDDAVLEFGLRRAQGWDGGLAASRAAIVGGCNATSNVLAGRMFGAPVAGTHAHSWVMSFDDEAESFRTYATGQPDNVILLVDTYDTRRGVERAIAVGHELAGQGITLRGIRLDSGDLVALSQAARARLDAEGFHETKVIASGDLDEHAIARLKADGARIDTWGVGTRLATASDEPALGGVYKLSAIRPHADAAWQPRLKRSDTPAKSSFPGRIETVRFCRDGQFVADCLFSWDAGGYPMADEPLIRLASHEPLEVPQEHAARFELVPWFRQGRRIRPAETLDTARDRARSQLAALPEACRRLEHPQPYPVGLSAGLHQLRQRLLEEQHP